MSHSITINEYETEPIFRCAKTGDTVYTLDCNNLFEEAVITFIGDNDDLKDYYISAKYNKDDNYEINFNAWGISYDKGIRVFWKPFNIPKRKRRVIKKELVEYVIYNKVKNVILKRFDNKNDAEYYFKNQLIKSKHNLVIICLKGGYDTII